MKRRARTWLVTVVLAASASCYFSEPAVNRDGGSGSADSSFASANVMFVTATNVSDGDLMSIASLDADCVARARTAGLPGTFVAWVSGEAGNAIDRLGSAAGWIRPDGKPFAATVDAIRNGSILYPPDIDENGKLVAMAYSVSAPPLVATGTLGDGVGSASCVSLASGIVGTPVGGTADWTDFKGAACSSLQAYCFETDRNVPIAPAVPTGAHRVFLSNPVSASIGLTGFDIECNSEANAYLAGIPHDTFTAFVTTAAQSAIERAAPGLLAGSIWYRLDGVEVSYAAGSGFSVPLNVGIDGTYVSHRPIWLGAATPEGSGSDSTNCSGWTSAATAAYADCMFPSPAGPLAYASCAGSSTGLTCPTSSGSSGDTASLLCFEQTQ